MTGKVILVGFQVCQQIVTRKNRSVRWADQQRTTACWQCHWLAHMSYARHHCSTTTYGRTILMCGPVPVAIQVKGEHTADAKVDIHPQKAWVDELKAAQAVQPSPFIPPIIYASRTHSQLAQVIRELRATAYRCPHSTALLLRVEDTSAPCLAAAPAGPNAATGWASGRRWLMGFCTFSDTSGAVLQALSAC